MNDNDPFEDIRGGAPSYGSLGGAGAEHQYSVKVERDPNKQGLWFVVSCDNCGQPNKILVSWDEFIFAMNGAKPPNWVYEGRYGGFHPNSGCKVCRSLLLVVFTPDECKRHLNAGVASRSVSPAYIQQGSQRVQAAQRNQHG